ncbi:MAG: tail fiber domain-containing protein [Parafilimonas sp.]
MKKNLSISAIIILIAFCNTTIAQTWKLSGNTLDSAGKIGSLNNYDVKFITTGGTRMIIKRNGNTGIGTNAPSEKLQVEGNEILNGDLILASSLGKGDINFTTDQQNIAFAAPGVSSSPMIFMSGTSGAVNERMVLAKSGGNEINTGMKYNFGRDEFVFMKNNMAKLTVDISNGRLGVNMLIPKYTLDVTGTSHFLGNVGIQTIPGARTLQVGATLGSLMGIGSAEYIQDFGTSTLATNNDWIPFSDNVWELGHSDRRWQDVWAVDGTINISDARDKTNVRDLNYGLKEIMQLHSIKFNWKNNAAAGDKLGVIAQEIQKVLPEVVRDWDYKTIDETSGKKEKVPAERLGVMYADIIPVLIKGIQEQQKEIEKQQDINKNLQQQIDQLKSIALSGNQINGASASSFSNVSLEQNSPNPVKNSTIIRYNIDKTKNAQLNIANADGKIIKQVQLNANSNYVNINCSAFASGTYYYSLIIDNAIVASNKMIVAK